MLLQLFGYAEMSISVNLQTIRKEKGLNQEQLAEQSGVSLTQISKIERNETDPRVSTIEKLAKALNCSVDQLLFNEATEGLTGLLKRAFERASKLDPQDKAALLKVINMACAGGTMMKTIDDLYEDAGSEAKEINRQYPNESFSAEDLVAGNINIEEFISKENQKYHEQIDAMAHAEAKANTLRTIIE